MKRLILISAMCVMAFAARAQQAPADAGAKLPAIDFGKEVLDARNKPFPMCPKVTDQCPDANWSLADVAYFALSTPSPKPQGTPQSASAEDGKATALGYRIFGAAAPVDLSTHERDMLRVALMQRATSQALGYAACRMVTTAEECEGK